MQRQVLTPIDVINIIDIDDTNKDDKFLLERSLRIEFSDERLTANTLYFIRLRKVRKKGGFGEISAATYIYKWPKNERPIVRNQILKYLNIENNAWFTSPLISVGKYTRASNIPNLPGSCDELFASWERLLSREYQALESQKESKEDLTEQPSMADPKDNRKWICLQCNYENPSVCASCVLCQCEKKSSAISTAVAKSPLRNSHSWSCGQCTYENTSNALCCEMCRGNSTIQEGGALNYRPVSLFEELQIPQRPQASIIEREPTICLPKYSLFFAGGATIGGFLGNSYLSQGAVIAAGMTMPGWMVGMLAGCAAVAVLLAVLYCGLVLRQYCLSSSNNDGHSPQLARGR